MLRISLFVALFAAGCVDNDPPQGGFGLPDPNKPTQNDPQQSPSDNATATELGCPDCTVVHDVTVDGDQITLLDPDGKVFCTRTTAASGVIVVNSCQPIASPR